MHIFDEIGMFFYFRCLPFDDGDLSVYQVASK